MSSIEERISTVEGIDKLTSLTKKLYLSRKIKIHTFKFQSFQ